MLIFQSHLSFFGGVRCFGPFTAIISPFPEVETTWVTVEGDIETKDPVVEGGKHWKSSLETQGFLVGKFSFENMCAFFEKHIAVEVNHI